MPRIPNSYKIEDCTKYVIYGSLLGDGSITKSKNMTNYRFSIAHSEKNYDYIEWKKSIINIPSSIWADKKRNLVQLQTRSCIELTELRNHFYKDGKKIFPCNVNLDDVLSPLSLAIWYMDDGCYSKRECIFTSEFISDEDILKIQKYLFERYKIETSIWSNNRIRVKRSSEDIFFELISEYVNQVPSMVYKISTKYVPLG